MFKTFFAKPAQKRYSGTHKESKTVFVLFVSSTVYEYLSKEIFGNRPKKLDWFLPRGACGLGTRLRELLSIGSQFASVLVENAWAFHVCCTWN